MIIKFNPRRLAQFLMTAALLLLLHIAAGFEVAVLVALAGVSVASKDKP